MQSCLSFVCRIQTVKPSAQAVTNSSEMDAMQSTKGVPGPDVSTESKVLETGAAALQVSTRATAGFVMLIGAVIRSFKVCLCASQRISRICRRSCTCAGRGESLLRTSFRRRPTVLAVRLARAKRATNRDRVHGHSKTVLDTASIR